MHCWRACSVAACTRGGAQNDWLDSTAGLLPRSHEVGSVEHQWRRPLRRNEVRGEGWAIHVEATNAILTLSSKVSWGILGAVDKIFLPRGWAVFAELKVQHSKPQACSWCSNRRIKDGTTLVIRSQNGRKIWWNDRRVNDESTSQVQPRISPRICTLTWLDTRGAPFLFPRFIQRSTADAGWIRTFKAQLFPLDKGEATRSFPISLARCCLQDFT